MSIEIERKFVVRALPAADLINGVIIRQGYIISDNSTTINITSGSISGYVEIKNSDHRFNYAIPKRKAVLINEEKDIESLTFRVRILGGKSFFTIKGPRIGITCLEVEFPIPLDDAYFLLDNLASEMQINKTRFIINHNSFCFEVDVFHGNNEGLIMAEVELTNEKIEVNSYPPGWSMIEVRGMKYNNSQLAKEPYLSWESRIQTKWI